MIILLLKMFQKKSISVTLLCQHFLYLSLIQFFLIFLSFSFSPPFFLYLHNCLNFIFLQFDFNLSHSWMCFHFFSFFAYLHLNTKFCFGLTTKSNFVKSFQKMKYYIFKLLIFTAFKESLFVC